MIAGVLRDLQEEGEFVRALIEFTCPLCGYPEAEDVTILPIAMLPELQPLVGQVCRICRDGERYIVRGDAQ